MSRIFPNFNSMISEKTTNSKTIVKMNTTMVMVAYEAPMVEVIEVEVEKGFATSPTPYRLRNVENEDWD